MTSYLNKINYDSFLNAALQQSAQTQNAEELQSSMFAQAQEANQALAQQNRDSSIESLFLFAPEAVQKVSHLITKGQEIYGKLGELKAQGEKVVSSLKTLPDDLKTAYADKVNEIDSLIKEGSSEALAKATKSYNALVDIGNKAKASGESIIKKVSSDATDSLSAFRDQSKTVANFYQDKVNARAKEFEDKFTQQMKSVDPRDIKLTEDIKGKMNTLLDNIKNDAAAKAEAAAQRVRDLAEQAQSVQNEAARRVRDVRQEAQVREQNASDVMMNNEITRYIEPANQISNFNTREDIISAYKKNRADVNKGFTEHMQEIDREQEFNKQEVINKQNEIDQHKQIDPMDFEDVNDRLNWNEKLDDLNDELQEKQNIVNNMDKYQVDARKAAENKIQSLRDETNTQIEKIRQPETSVTTEPVISEPERIVSEPIPIRQTPLQLSERSQMPASYEDLRMRASSTRIPVKIQSASDELVQKFRDSRDKVDSIQQQIRNETNPDKIESLTRDLDSAQTNLRLNDRMMQLETVSTTKEGANLFSRFSEGLPSSIPRLPTSLPSVSEVAEKLPSALPSLSEALGGITEGVGLLGVGSMTMQEMKGQLKKPSDILQATAVQADVAGSLVQKGAAALTSEAKSAVQGGQALIEGGLKTGSEQFDEIKQTLRLAKEDAKGQINLAKQVLGGGVDEGKNVLQNQLEQTNKLRGDLSQQIGGAKEQFGKTASEALEEGKTALQPISDLATQGIEKGSGLIQSIGEKGVLETLGEVTGISAIPVVGEIAATGLLLGGVFESVKDFFTGSSSTPSAVSTIPVPAYMRGIGSAAPTIAQPAMSFSSAGMVRQAGL